MEVVMSKKQLSTLFICTLIPWIVGNGLVPLLPVYVTQLGANPAIAGYYLAFSYLALAVGALSAGWVSDSRFRRKVPLIIAALSGIPFAWLMGQVKTIWGLTLLTALLWFAGGLALALVSILTGLSAGAHERGFVFGILSLTSGLGALAGGLGVGLIVDHWGFSTMFNMLAIFMVLWPISALLVEEKSEKESQSGANLGQKSSHLGQNFYLLFAASSIISTSSFIVVLTRSFIMNDLGFSPLEISSTGAVGGLISMPLPLLMGWLSDRMNRKFFLLIGYLAGIIGLILLAFSTVLWHFWVMSILMGLTQGNATIGYALTTDLVPKESLGKGLALIGTTGWIGGVIGFAVAGYTMDNLGLIPTIIIGNCLAMCAIGFLAAIKTKSMQSTRKSLPVTE